MKGMNFTALIVSDDQNIIKNNITSLKSSMCNIVVVNYKSINIDLPYNIKEFKFSKMPINDCINDMLKYIEGNVAIIDNSIIQNNFIATFVSSFDPSSLNILRTDVIRDINIPDHRIGKNVLSKDDFINYSIAFNRDVIQFIPVYTKLYDYCKRNNIYINFCADIKTIRTTNKAISYQKQSVLRKKAIKSIVPEYINRSTKPIQYVIIIPFMYNGDRFDLFESSVEKLYEYSKKYKNLKIVVHETSPERYLTNDFIKKYGIEYIYSKWDDVFHRAWALNVPAKHFVDGDVYVFFDADLIITDEWIDELMASDPTKVYVGWGKMINLNIQGTKQYMQSKKIATVINNIERIRYPNLKGAAGGINIIPKNVFFAVNGWDESFSGTYGGEDNVMLVKLEVFGYKINIFKSTVYHLYHSHSTYKDPKRFNIFKKLLSYTKNQWIHHVNNMPWGELSDVTIKGVGISAPKEKECKMPIDTSSYKNLRILWCKIDTSTRVAGHLHYIIDEIKKYANVEVHTRMLSEHPAIEQKRIYDTKEKYEYVNHIIENQGNYDCVVIQHPIFFMGEWEKVNIPVFMLFEDQHGETNRYQLKMAIKYGWHVLSKYQLKPFNDDLNTLVKSYTWMPHSVNTSIFKDYKLEKDVFVLQTGALYQVYKTRNEIKSFFDNKKLGPNWYRYIPRPKETDINKWPVGKDYAKEINKAWLTVCCGSIYEYSVMKFFEIPAAGSIIYSDYFKELGDLGFEPDKNMIVIDNNDIMGQLHSLRGNKNFLYDIMHNGKILVDELYNLKEGAFRLLSTIKEKI